MVSTYRLVRFSREGDFLTVLHSLVHVDLEHLLLRHDFLPLAVGASVLVADGFPGASAATARLLHLLDHPGAQLPDRDLNSGALAAGARARSPGFRSFPDHIYYKFLFEYPISFVTSRDGAGAEFVLTPCIGNR